MKKTIRIGCGSGGCSYERLEPAIELVKKGNIDYLVFECLSERTIAEAQNKKLKNPDSGYNPMLEERMELFLPLLKEYSFKIVSNMGGANTASAVKKIIEIAKNAGIQNLKIAAVSGDDITNDANLYRDSLLWDQERTLGALNNIISINVYLGANAIKEALDDGADIVITGRVADPSLFVGPILHEFQWQPDELEKMGQAILAGHMMECCAQLTGGYYADPGYKDIENLHLLGHPIAEINEDAELLFTKVDGSGGLVSTDICKEQLLYEITDPAHYITPDGIADFSHVSFISLGKDIVKAVGATSLPPTDTYKVNIGYIDGYIGVGEVSFGGSNALQRAQLAADVIQKRWEIIKIKPDDFRIDFIGYNSLYGTDISSEIHHGTFSEIRLRIAVRTHNELHARKLIRELQCMYINGPAGSSGIASYVEPILAIENMLVDKSKITYTVDYNNI